MKKCTTCKQEKIICVFGKNRGTIDGLHTECKQCRKDYYIKNKQKICEYSNNYNLLHINEKKAYRALEHIKLKASVYERKIRHRRNARKKERKLSDINYRLRENLRKRLHQAIKYDYKAGSAITDLGCSIQQFKDYIQSKWLPGMSWINWGQVGWHLDHIIPLSSFNLGDKDQFVKACHYTNYQPLWAADNLNKSNKLNWSK